MKKTTVNKINQC